ncbi:MAG: hypothetical protein ABFC67_04830 [Mizugakiibacter sp.]|uniref:hypothetical protein n=1 Tax=Mizugakiibacter sp. TaxID=1972610 RepID=UPI00320D846E
MTDALVLVLLVAAYRFGVRPLQRTVRDQTAELARLRAFRASVGKATAERARAIQWRDDVRAAIEASRAE